MESNNAQPTVAIIGAGIGGVYLVAMLGLIGCKVRLHDIDDSRLKDLREAKGIQVEGMNGGFAPLDIATTDLKASTDGAETPATAAWIRVQVSSSGQGNGNSPRQARTAR